jgi:hypothetical protein
MKFCPSTCCCVIEPANKLSRTLSKYTSRSNMSLPLYCAPQQYRLNAIALGDTLLAAHLTSVNAFAQLFCGWETLCDLLWLQAVDTLIRHHCTDHVIVVPKSRHVHLQCSELRFIFFFDPLGIDAPDLRAWLRLAATACFCG